MDRLTYKIKDKTEMLCRYESCDTCEENCPSMNKDDCPCLQDVLEKLVEYEELEEQGRLLKLPCAVGTTVYSIAEDCGGDTLNCKIRECRNCDDFYRFVVDNIFDISLRDEIGKTIFLTKEEAKSALKRMNKKGKRK